MLPATNPNTNPSMASLLLKGVHKRLGLSGLSCSSADATSVVSATTRAIDRHSPHLRDPHRSSKPPPPPRPSSVTSSKQHHHHGSGGSSSKKKKKSTTSSTTTIVEKRALVSPATSSRFLLNSSRLQSDVDAIVVVEDQLPPSFIDVPFPAAADEEEQEAPVQQLATESSSDIVAATTMSNNDDIHVHEHEDDMTKKTKAAAMARRSCSSATTATRSSRTTAAAQEVVVLKVSLHCKGCAGKVKKHISKMEGVTSFDIDIATKKVTVVGDVTPLGVLNSVSKVKPAHFWPSPPPPRASASF